MNLNPKRTWQLTKGSSPPKFTPKINQYTALIQYTECFQIHIIHILFLYIIYANIFLPIMSVVSSCWQFHSLPQGLHHPNIVEYKHSWLELSRRSEFCPFVPFLFILMQYCTWDSFSPGFFLSWKWTSSYEKLDTLIINRMVWRPSTSSTSSGNRCCKKPRLAQTYDSPNPPVGYSIVWHKLYLNTMTL